VAEKRFTIQHTGCNKHIWAVESSNKHKSVQMLLQHCSPWGGNKSLDFFINLCDALISVKILLSALNNEKVKNFV
jgi:hypothetical protein